MKKLCLLICLCCACGLSFAAQRTVTYLPDTSFRMTGTSSFKEVRVTDARKDKSNIGIMAQGEFRNERTIMPDGPMDAGLTMFGTNFISEVPKGDLTCLLVVRDFSLRFSEAAPGTFYLAGDIFIGKDNSYRLVAALDTLCELYGGLQDSKTLVGKVLGDMLIIAANAGTKAMAGERYTTAQAENRFTALCQKYPLYSGAPIKEGMYNTIDEFLQNAPGTTNIHRRDRQDHVGRHRPPITTFYFDDNGERADKIDNMFAIYSEGEWFTFSRTGKFARMAVRNGDYYKVMSLGYIRANAGVPIGGPIGINIPMAILISATSHNTKGKRNGIYETRFNPERKQFMPVRKISD